MEKKLIISTVAAIALSTNIYAFSFSDMFTKDTPPTDKHVSMFENDTKQHVETQKTPKKAEEIHKDIKATEEESVKTPKAEVAETEVKEIKRVEGTEEEVVTRADTNISKIETVEEVDIVTKKVEGTEEEVVTPADKNISKMETAEEIIVLSPADINITQPSE